MVETGRKVFLALIVISVLIAPRLSQAQITPELVEAAKKEGEVIFYGAITVNSSKAIGDAFEKKYGIKLQHWRGDATELINRALAEARAGKPAFDVTLGNEVVMTTFDGDELEIVEQEIQGDVQVGRSAVMEYWSAGVLGSPHHSNTPRLQFI